MDHCICGRKLELVCSKCRQIPSGCKCDKGESIQNTDHDYAMIEAHATDLNL